MVWLGNQVPGNSVQKRFIKLSINHIQFRQPALVDLLTGKAYSFNSKNLAVTGDSSITVNIPVYDSPVIITEKSEIELTM